MCVSDNDWSLQSADLEMRIVLALHNSIVQKLEAPYNILNLGKFTLLFIFSVTNKTPHVN